jgi:hypothetical protein
MLIERRGKTMQVNPSACGAPTAAVRTAVRVGANGRFLFGAVLAAEDGEIRVGDRVVVMGSAPREIAGFLAIRRINAWSGHSYAWELTGSPGRDSGGAVRAGSVRCSDRSDADCLPEAVADLDGNRESCGDLPG